MNSSVNSSTGFSAYEIKYAQRPKFPLTQNLVPRDLQALPKDVRSYVASK